MIRELAVFLSVFVAIAGFLTLVLWLAVETLT